MLILPSHTTSPLEVNTKTLLASGLLVGLDVLVPLRNLLVELLLPVLALRLLDLQREDLELQLQDLVLDFAARC